MQRASPSQRAHEAVSLYRRLHPEYNKPLDDYSINHIIDSVLSPENTYHPQRRNRSARSEPWF